MELCYRNNPKSLFRKYAKLVTWFANQQLGRDYLKQNNLYIPSEKLGLLLPNGYVRLGTIGKDKIEAQLIVTTRACYAPKLYPALYAIDRLHQWIQDFDEAKMILMGQLGLISWGRMPALAKSLRFLTLEKNPDADPETTSVDGYAQRAAGGTSFADVRDGVGTASADTNGANDYPVAFNSTSASDTWGGLVRYFHLYDTSLLTASATISAAVQSMYINSFIDYYTTQNMRLVLATIASNTAVVAADFQGTVANTTAQTDADLDIGALTTSAYNDWTLNATGRGNISLTSITKFGYKITADVTNTAPTWSINQEEIVRGTSADAAGTTTDPKLVVTYTVPAAGDKKFTLLGVG